MSVTLKIENTYEDGHESVVEVQVDDPEGSSQDEMEMWWEDEVYPLTGDGYGMDNPRLGCVYEATIIRADDEKLVGLNMEWG